MTADHKDRRPGDYPYHMSIPTRWGDNDMLGHLNNVIYYRFFEAVVVRFMMEVVGVDWTNDPLNPQAVETLCRFHRSLSFPDVVDACLRVEKVGRSSVTFDIALFGPGHEEPAATGHFVDVFVDNETDRSASIPDDKRQIFLKYQDA